jgi:GntR family transcriptional regulator
MVVTGALSPGEPLPSMRLLAKELRISVITTKRAYEELERDGFIETVAGKGSFVSGGNFELVREERLRRIEENLQRAAETARQSGVSLGELLDILKMLYGEEE